jgi:hypothetical protein
VRGGNNLCDGPVDNDAALATAMARVQERGFGHQPETTATAAGGAAKKARIEGAHGPGQVTVFFVTALTESEHFAVFGRCDFCSSRHRRSSLSCECYCHSSTVQMCMKGVRVSAPSATAHCLKRRCCCCGHYTQHNVITHSNTIAH